MGEGRDFGGGRIIRRMVLEYDLEHEKQVRAAAFGWLGSRVSGEDGVVV